MKFARHGSQGSSNSVNSNSINHKQQSRIKMVIMIPIKRVIIFPRLVKDLYLLVSNLKFFILLEMMIIS